MTEAIEWIQCKGCGRRHRWTAERAGQMFECDCGRRVYCPEGASADVQPGPADTLVEDVDSPTATAPDIEGLDLEALTAGSLRRVIKPLAGIEARRAERSLILWSLALVVGVAMVIHAVVLFDQIETDLLVQIYTGLAVVITPVALWRFLKAKKRWQRGRGFLESLRQSLERFDHEHGAPPGH